MNTDLTEGSITGRLLLFAFPIMIGNLLQQFYNVADTLIVGRYLGEHALAAVGSSYTLMVFLTSIILGLCMGSGAFISMQFGGRQQDRLENGLFLSFFLIGSIAAVINLLVYLGVDGILIFLRVPAEVQGLMKEYLLWIFAGIMATFLYNFVSNVLRAVGNSMIPLLFLGGSALLNIALDLYFIRSLGMGVAGAAIATVISQYVSGIGITLYYLIWYPQFHVHRENMHWSRAVFKDIKDLSLLTCFQQSIMNFGILMVQGLVNSFGTTVMAAFAATVKIDSFAYSPVQDFGNAFSTFIAQNYGAGKTDRIQKGLKRAVLTSVLFCFLITAFVVTFAQPLMGLFVDASNEGIISVGVSYLRIEASFYFGIGILFLFYGYYRAIHRPGISVVLTVVSLGTRVLLAYTLSAIPFIGVTGIWAAIPIGWILADITGALYLRKVNHSGS